MPNKVDAFNIPKRMTKPQLQWWILFGIAVAGKGAKQTQAKLEAFLMDMPPPRRSFSRGIGYPPAESSPFERVQYLIDEGNLLPHLKKHRLGKYKLLSKAYRAAIKINLDNVTVENLEKIPGIGPKTARMTILYYEPNAEVVPLDVHVLRWLREQGHDAPKATPGSRKKYFELEQAFITEAKNRGMSVRDLDTQVWKHYARA